MVCFLCPINSLLWWYLVIKAICLQPANYTISGKAMLRLCWGSGLWKAQIARIVPIAYCRLPLIWKASITPGQKTLAFARYRRALSHLCGAGYQYIISAEEPLYPCRDGQKIHHLDGKNNIRYLLYFQKNIVLSLSNVPKLEYKWHPPFNSGAPAR